MRKNNTLIFFKLIILVNILFFFNSCNYKKDSNVFFIGGEIINPSSSEVNIYRNNIKIDSIELDNNVLIISSETSNNVSNENLRLNEFNYSSFQRSFKIPESVNLDKIKGNYKNGILKVLLPKKKDSISKTNRVITIG